MDSIKEWMKKHWKLLGIGVLLLGFLLHPFVVLSEIRIDFTKEDYSAGNHWKVFTAYSEQAGLDSIRRTYERPGEARVAFFDATYGKGTYVKRMDPIDYDYGNEVSVRSMTFYFNGFYGGQLEGEELFQAFTPNDQVEMQILEDGSLGLLIKGEDSQLIPTEVFQNFYIAAAKRLAWTGILYFIPLMAAAVFVFSFYNRYVRKLSDDRFFRASYTVLYVVGICAIVLIVYGAFVGSSEINPDESESVYSVLYYTNHWKIPDMRKLPREAFSVFGTARLSELNLYYILSAQIARFITMESGTRFFGVLLAVGLFFLAFLNLKKNSYLLGVVFLTPQVWYLYTYCTSDALDFAVSVLVLYQLANPESMLQKLLREGVKKKDAWRVLLLGFLLSNIFMSKQNYYVIAIYAFSMLLVELLTAEKEKRRTRLIGCLWLAGSALLFLGIRYIPEFLHYGIHRQQVILELQNEIAIPELRPASPPEIQSPAFNLYGKGVSLREFLFHKGFHKTLFRSFVGTYGCLEFPSPKWYVAVMRLLYLMLYVGMSISIWHGKAQKERKVKFLLLHLMAFISWVLVVYNGWFIDFQAQGRYMLPVLIFVAHGISLNPKMAEKRWFQCLISVTAVLSLYSFACYCIPNIQPIK